MKRNLLALAAILATSGCTTTRSTVAAAVKDADDAMVAGCTLVGNVTGTDPYVAQLGMDNAKNRAAEIAAKRGATHVVWGDFQTSGLGTTAFGRAYQCSSPSASKE
jgi:1-aminocyclopropane-1-carboxylate deaminase/D-cysteine desulfhydrase-like pyridoxal-dependent ACC family enzyme